ncbi:MAG TPA: NUDIX hydrolase, partial [Kineosporiaceae bacterium]|nr:NUDIX hydrolase [Kineosporiaceae bacterium]
MNGISLDEHAVGQKVTARSAMAAPYGGTVAVHDGNGWVECRCGQRHWGRHGAAGLLLARTDAVTGLEVLLQLRAGWTHHGGSWALPGGARDSHEDSVTAALREAREETGIDPASVSVVGEHPGVDHLDWSYTYVLALASTGVVAVAATTESDELRWVSPDAVSLLALLPAFGV